MIRPYLRVPLSVVLHKDVTACDAITAGVVDLLEDADGICRASVHEISKVSGYSMRQIHRSLRRLEKSGAVRVVERTQGAGTRVGRVLSSAVVWEMRDAIKAKAPARNLG